MGWAYLRWHYIDLSITQLFDIAVDNKKVLEYLEASRNTYCSRALKTYKVSECKSNDNLFDKEDIDHFFVALANFGMLRFYSDYLFTGQDIFQAIC